MNSIRPHHILLAGALLVSTSACRAQDTTAPALPGLSAAATSEITSARAAILAGVTDVIAPGLPGVVSVYRPRAFPVILGATGGGKNATVAPAVAAAFTSKGRAVAFGHDGFLGKESWGVGQSQQLLLNSVRWTQNGKPGRVGVLAGDLNADLVTLLKANGLDAVALSNGAKLDEFSALVINGHRLTAADEVPLQKFVTRGGGLVMATTGWGWNWGNETQTLSKDYFGNRLMAPYGLVWSEATVEGTKKAGSTVFSVSDIPALTNAGSALDLLEASVKDPKAMTVGDAKLASRSLTDLFTGVPTGDEAIQNRFRALLATDVPLQIPSGKTPLGPDDPGTRLRYLLQLRQNQLVPVEKIKADPAASTFPGAVLPMPKPSPKPFRWI